LIKEAGYDDNMETRIPKENKMRRLLFLALLVCFTTITAKAQDDPAKADPKHFKVEIDNAQVRVLRDTPHRGRRLRPTNMPDLTWKCN